MFRFEVKSDSHLCLMIFFCTKNEEGKSPNEREYKVVDSMSNSDEGI